MVHAMEQLRGGVQLLMYQEAHRTDEQAAVLQKQFAYLGYDMLHAEAGIFHEAFVNEALRLYR